MESKKIGTFKEFLKEQSIKKINEARVSLEVDWWDSCIVEVMQIMKDECAGSLDYETLVNYVKGKFQILGRPDPGYDEGFLLQHIKDLIFQLHGDSFVCDGMCNWGDTSEIQAKGLVVSELAKVILDKVMETIKSPDDPTPGETRVSLVDKQPRTLVPMTEPVSDEEEDYVDDLPFESHKVSPVKGVKDYTQYLNETVGIIEISCQDKCIQYCLDRIKEEVGSYNADEIFNVASQTVDPKVKARIVLLYVKDMVIDYLSGEKAQLAVVNTNGKKGKDIPKEALEKGLDQLYQDIADEVLVKIVEINGVSVEDGKAEENNGNLYQRGTSQGNPSQE